MCKRKEFDKYVNKLRSQKDKLIHSLSKVDKKICDINHIIELGTYTDKQSISILKILRKARIERRVFKDKLNEIEPIVEQTKKWKWIEPKEKIYTFRELNETDNPRLIGLMVDVKIKAKKVNK